MQKQAGSRRHDKIYPGTTISNLRGRETMVRSRSDVTSGHTGSDVCLHGQYVIDLPVAGGSLL